jgi:hypothetical protein
MGEPPVTPAERYVITLAEKLQYRDPTWRELGELRDYVHNLELQCIALAKDNRQLRKDLAVRLPPMVLTAKEMGTQSVANGGAFEWRLECRPYRVWFGEFDRTKRDVMRSIRRQTLRELLREARAQFEKTWDANGWPR